MRINSSDQVLWILIFAQLMELFHLFQHKSKNSRKNELIIPETMKTKKIRIIRIVGTHRLEKRGVRRGIIRRVRVPGTVGQGSEVEFPASVSIRHICRRIEANCLRFDTELMNYVRHGDGGLQQSSLNGTVLWRRAHTILITAKAPFRDLNFLCELIKDPNIKLPHWLWGHEVLNFVNKISRTTYELSWAELS